MPLVSNYNDIENYQTLCYQTATQSDLDEGETLEKLVSQFNFFRPGWGWTDDSKESITRLHPITAELVFGSMNIGLASITAKNAKEVFLRHRMLAVVGGAPLRDGEGNEIFITREDVKAHIGLTINVAEISKAKFHGNLIRTIRQLAGESGNE